MLLPLQVYLLVIEYYQTTSYRPTFPSSMQIRSLVGRVWFELSPEGRPKVDSRSSARHFPGSADDMPAAPAAATVSEESRKWNGSRAPDKQCHLDTTAILFSTEEKVACGKTVYVGWHGPGTLCVTFIPPEEFWCLKPTI